jgi:hypothetical protein
MRPLTPIRRTRFPVQMTGGNVVADAGVWWMPSRGGMWMIHRPGGWRSALQLARLLWTAVRR